MKALKFNKGILRIIIPPLILLLVIALYVGERYLFTNRSTRASSEHYEITATRQDSELSQYLLGPLEDNYKTVNEAMGFENKSVHHVIIFKTYKNYQNFLFNLDPKWRDSYIGYVSAEGQNIKVTSTNAKDIEDYTRENLVTELQYENVLDILNHNRYSIEKEPMWLIEGIATHFTADDSLKSDYLETVKHNDFPDMNTILAMPQGRGTLMSQNVDAFGQENGMAFSYYMVDYIINQYGYPTLKAIFDSPDNLFTEIEATSNQDFINKVQNYINQQ